MKLLEFKIEMLQKEQKKRFKREILNIPSLVKLILQYKGKGYLSHHLRECLKLLRNEKLIDYYQLPKK